MSQSNLPENEDDAQKSNGLSSDEFEFYFQFTKPLVIELSTPEERAVAAAWVQKLEAEPETEEEKQSRLDYLKLLLFVLQRGHLTGIFKKQPPSGPLQPFAQGFTMSDLGNMMIERDDGLGCGGGDTRDVPYTIEISNDLREFVAAQEIPNFGVQMYYAWSSEEPIHEWSLFDEEKFPKHIVEKIKLLKEIKSDDKTSSNKCSTMGKKKGFELPIIEKYSKKKVKTPQEIERSQGRSYHTYLGLVSRMGGGFKDNCDDDPERYGNQSQPSRISRKSPCNVRKCAPGLSRFQGEGKEISPEGDYGTSCAPPAMIGGNNPNTVRICHCPCTHHLPNCEAHPQGHGIQIFEEPATPTTFTKSGHDTSQFTRSVPRQKNISRRLIYPPEIEVEPSNPPSVSCPQDRSVSPPLQSLPRTPTDECSPAETQNLSRTPVNERLSPDMTRTYTRNPCGTPESEDLNRDAGCDGGGGGGGGGGGRVETVERANYFEPNVIHCYDPQHQDPNVNLQLQTVPRSQLQPCSQLQRPTCGQQQMQQSCPQQQMQQSCPQQQLQQSCPQQQMQQSCPQQQMQQSCPQQQMQQSCPQQQIQQPSHQQRLQQPCHQQHMQQPCPQQRLQQPYTQQRMQQSCPQQQMQQHCPQQQIQTSGSLKMQQEVSEWYPINQAESFQPCQESPRGRQGGITGVCGTMGVNNDGVEEDLPQPGQQCKYMTHKQPCAPPPTPCPISTQTCTKLSRASPGRGGRCPQQNLDSGRVDFGPSTDTYDVCPSSPQAGPSNCNQINWVSPTPRRNAFPEQNNMECLDDMAGPSTRCPMSEPADRVCPRTKKPSNLNSSKHQPCATITKSSGHLRPVANASENIKARTEAHKEKCNAPLASCRSGCGNDSMNQYGSPLSMMPCQGQSCLHTPTAPSAQCSPHSTQWITPPHRIVNASAELNCLDVGPSDNDDPPPCPRVPKTTPVTTNFPTVTKRMQNTSCPNESAYESTEYAGLPSRLTGNDSCKAPPQSCLAQQAEQTKPPSRPASPQQPHGTYTQMPSYACRTGPTAAQPGPYVGGNEQNECESEPESADECPQEISSNECLDEGNASPLRPYESPSNQEVLNERCDPRRYERPKSSERRMICSTPQKATAPHVSAFLSTIYGPDTSDSANDISNNWQPVYGATDVECSAPVRQSTPCPRRK